MPTLPAPSKPFSRPCDFRHACPDGAAVCLHPQVRPNLLPVSEPHCGRCSQRLVEVAPLPAPAAADCGKSPAPRAVRPPTFPIRLANFTVAAIGHFLRGNPTAGQATIDRRLAICQSCPLFLADPKDTQAGVCGHEQCGCTLKNARAYLNKLAWADQACPDGRWRREDNSADGR